MNQLEWRSVGLLELTALPTIDDNTAIRVVDTEVDVISEGQRRRFDP